MNVHLNSENAPYQSILFSILKVSHPIMPIFHIFWPSSEMEEPDFENKACSKRDSSQAFQRDSGSVGQL